MAKTSIEIPMNRVEGDLEIKVDVEDGVVTDAHSSGIMFRGFENILRGRGALDGLVLTPRICGLCSVSHLSAAGAALDRAAEIPVAPNGQRVRNITLMAEHIQSDVRQAMLMFCADFTSCAHERRPLYGEAVRRYQPFAGSAVVETLRETKHVLEIVAILGGQWPHSAFIVPGGVVSLPSAVDIQRCRNLLAGYRRFYERRILGCTVERWLEVSSAAALDAWLDESASHRDSELGFFLRFGRQAGLDRIGRGHESFLSFGGLPIPEGSAAVGPAGGSTLVAAGIATKEAVSAFDQAEVTEHLSHSWFVDDGIPRHPFEGVTRPYASGHEGKKYSWMKAPRYASRPAETGPLAELVIGRDPLFVDLIRSRGTSALVRELARLARPATLIPTMDRWLAEIVEKPGPFCCHAPAMPNGRAFGLVEASRGALGHWIEIENDTIAHYQVITPTAWNGSPRDDLGVRGPWEEALVGTPVEDVENPVMTGHVVRSFDPCLVCAVHAVGKSGKRGSVRLGT